MQQPVSSSATRIAVTAEQVLTPSPQTVSIPVNPYRQAEYLFRLSSADDGALDNPFSGRNTFRAEPSYDLHAKCWRYVVFATVAGIVTLTTVTIALFIAVRDIQATKVGDIHSGVLYYGICLIGGLLSGIPHLMLCPLDTIKCRMQLGEFSSVSSGWSVLWRESKVQAALYRPRSTSGCVSPPLQFPQGYIDRLVQYWNRLAILYRGWQPTGVGYCLQGALKFGFYEIFKAQFAMLFPVAAIVRWRTLLLLVSSAGAEIIADVALAPFETVKVRMQTGSDRLDAVVSSLWCEEGLRGFFRCLPALWARQVPYTMVKFSTYEVISVWLKDVLLSSQHGPGLTGAGGMVVVAVLAGYIAGVGCALASNPADTLVSLLTQPTSKDLNEDKLMNRRYISTSEPNQQQQRPIVLTSPLLFDMNNNTTTSSFALHHNPTEAHTMHSSTIGFTTVTTDGGASQGLLLQPIGATHRRVLSQGSNSSLNVAQQNQPVGPTVWQSIRRLGCRGLYRGLTARIVVVGSLTSLQWAIYVGFKTVLLRA